MVVFAANITQETQGLINDLLATDKFVRFSLQNKLNLADNTILIRLALMTLENQLPTNEYIAKNKAALLRPHEFDDFLKEKVGTITSAV